MDTQNASSPAPGSIAYTMTAYLDMVRITRSKRTYMSYKTVSIVLPNCWKNGTLPRTNRP